MLPQRILFVAAVLLYTGYLPSASVLFAQDPARAKVEKYLENFRDGARHEFVMLPLTDGVRLATDIFLPPQGNGPWPVLLFRTPYDRFYTDAAATATRLRAVLVCQSQRGRFESEGTLPRGSFANEINDSHDVVEWCAKQSWCDGRVLMWGASGAGISPANAIWSRSPHLTAVSISDTADDAHRYFRFQQGARRLVYNWFTNRNEKVPVWPRPTTEPYDITARSQFLAERSRDNQTYFLAKAGWYDQFYESALESFAALAPAGRAHLVMHPKGHGAIPLGGKPLASKPLPPEMAPPTLETLLYSPEKLPKASRLTYFMMGDAEDTRAAGNCWLTTDRWPVPHMSIDFFLHADRTLSPTKPHARAQGSLVYDYDPHRPVPSIGGNHWSSDRSGPLDQRPLDERSDVLRFVTQPLDEPMAITGAVQVDLHFTTDATDTMFVAKLVDVYPDGYAAIVLEKAGLARYFAGLDKPQPLNPLQSYCLQLNLGSTSIAFHRGHRIALYVTSSSDNAYEVHPNRYETSTSTTAFRTAHNTIHCEPNRSSKMSLPVVSLP